MIKHRKQLTSDHRGLFHDYRLQGASVRTARKLFKKQAGESITEGLAKQLLQASAQAEAPSEELEMVA